jgi:hypothetical protein
MQVCDLCSLCLLRWRAGTRLISTLRTSVAPDRGIDEDHGGRIVGRRVLVKPLPAPYRDS